MSPLPHIVWDMGGVLYPYFTELMLSAGAELGWPLDRVALGPTGSVPDADYELMLSGDITERQYVAIVVARLADVGVDFDPYGDLLWRGQERPRTWETIGKIHEAGHRQAMLTNDASSWLGPNWWETWEHSLWFEVIVDASTLDHPKPHPRPYLAAAEALDVPLYDCLFIDDMPVNCEGAEATGMDSHRFFITVPDTSLDRLEARLGI